MNPSDKTARPSLILAIVFTLAFMIATAVECKAQTHPHSPLKIGFLFVGTIADKTWNYTHNQARLYVESKLAKQVETTFAENVPESGEAERIMEKMISQGVKLIFATSYGYLEPVLHVAARHPEVKFMQLNRFENRSNLGTYFFLDFQPLYAAGVVAARTTKTNTIGFVGLQPVPQLVQEVNALALGARSVNPKAKVKVIWTNSWNDPPVESEVARALVEGGADVLAFSPLSLVKTAESCHANIIGCDSDLHSLSKEYWLTGSLLNWGPFYTGVAKSVLDGTWKSGVSVREAAGGNVKLAQFGKAVAKNVQDEGMAVMHKIETGELQVFRGPLKDREGRTRLNAGQKPDIAWLFSMDFFVSGVEGTLPKN